MLVLLPTVSNKMLAKWQGPYPNVRQIGPVTYEINMFDHVRKKRILHVNMLKPWHSPANLTLLAHDLTDPQDLRDVLFWEAPAEATALEQEAVVSTHLNREQHQQLMALLREYRETMRVDPGKTSLAEHSIDTVNASLVRLPPYRVPYAYKDAVEQVLSGMLEVGIVEPSSSEWAAPIVLVKKKDGTLRFCVNY